MSNLRNLRKASLVLLPAFALSVACAARAQPANMPNPSLPLDLGVLPATDQAITCAAVSKKLALAIAEKKEEDLERIRGTVLHMLSLEQLWLERASKSGATEQDRERVMQSLQKKALRQEVGEYCLFNGNHQFRALSESKQKSLRERALPEFRKYDPRN